LKLYRIFALIERDMRKFFRNPALMMASMVFPLVQLVVLGYAFGGKITKVRVALVDKDTGAEALPVRKGLNAIRIDGGTRHHRDRRPDCRHSAVVGAAATVLSCSRPGGHFTVDAQLHVSAHGARQRSASPAGHFRRP